LQNKGNTVRRVCEASNRTGIQDCQQL
jgi:hypothetical protein